MQNLERLKFLRACTDVGENRVTGKRPFMANYYDSYCIHLECMDVECFDGKNHKAFSLLMSDFVSRHDFDGFIVNICTKFDTLSNVKCHHSAQYIHDDYLMIHYSILVKQYF